MVAAATPEQRTTRLRNGSGVSSVEYVFDDTREICCSLLFLQQVAHQLRIGKLQKRAKCLFIRVGRRRVMIVEIGQQQFVEFAHAAAA